MTESVKANNELYEALNRFRKIELNIQMNMDVVVTDPLNREYNFSYASLDEIQAKIKKPLNDCGLLVVQTVGKDCSVSTTLIHMETGRSISDTASFPSHSQLSYQMYGQAITYLKRYSLVTMLGINAEKNDLDANTADGNKLKPKVNGKPVLDNATMQQMVDALNEGQIQIVERQMNKYELTDAQKQTLTTLINSKKAAATMFGEKRK